MTGAIGFAVLYVGVASLDDGILAAIRPSAFEEYETRCEENDEALAPSKVTLTEATRRSATARAFYG